MTPEHTRASKRDLEGWTYCLFRKMFVIDVIFFSFLLDAAKVKTRGGERGACLLGHVVEGLGELLLAEGQLADGPNFGILKVGG